MEYPEEILLRNAIANLDTSIPTNVILQDILTNEYFNPALDSYGMDDEYFEGDSIYDVIGEDNIDETVTKTEEQNQDSGNTTPGDFSYDNYSHPDYLDNVAGKTITMPNGEVRTYSADGTSYSIPAESWMGIGQSSYQITTHNKLSGVAYGEPSKQYIGISDDQARPYYMAAATMGNPVGLGKGIIGPVQQLTKPASGLWSTIKGSSAWEIGEDVLSGLGGLLGWANGESNK